MEMGNFPLSVEKCFTSECCEQMKFFNTRREFGVPKQPCNALFIVQTPMKCETILVQHFLKSECRDYKDNLIIAMVIFLHVTIKCNSDMTFSCFRLKAHLVFHWCLYVII